MYNDQRITYFGQTDARNKKVNFGIKAEDRTRHVYVIGKTGMGKSTLLENMAVQDIKNGEGLAFIDPHGKSADLLLEYIPPERMKDVVYFAPFDTEYPISFNVLEQVDADRRHLVVSGLMSTFKKIWQDAWSARMEYILTNTLLALLEYPGATLLGVNRMLSEKDFRKDVISHITDISVKNFWTQEFANYTERMAAESVPAIQNKIGQFTANALIRNMIGQAKSSFDIRELMDDKKIMIINLSKGKIGESNANLLGGMLITKIYLAAMSRADLPERTLRMMPNFYLYVDEFQNFANESFADILSEARKYKLNLTVAHQYIEQMEEEVRAAVFGNVGTMIVFRVGATDAEYLEKEFMPTFTAEDIVNLGRYQLYLKLMIDGVSSSPFSATNLPPIKPPEVNHTKEVIETSRQQFAHTRADVEKMIEDWHKPVVKAPAVPKPTVISAPTPVAPVATPVSAPAVKPITVAPQPPRPQQSQPKPNYSKPAAPAKPSVQPLAQPFKQAFKEVIEKKPEVPASASAPKPAAPVQAPVQPVPRVVAEPAPIQKPIQEPVRPVSLTSLSKPGPKNNDGKVPTQKNVNDLKSALASIIGNAAQAAPVAQAPVSAPVKIEPRTETPSELKKEERAPIPAHPITPHAAEEVKQKEVSREVLEKVLKVD
jgi:energy-coupling factor transporter ATP-binding protein EcfA2